MTDTDTTARALELIATVEAKLPKWEAWFPNPESEVEVPRAALLALVAHARSLAGELDQYAEVVARGRRLPAPDLAQDPALAAFVLGNLEGRIIRLDQRVADLKAALSDILDLMDAPADEIGGVELLVRNRVRSVLQQEDR